MKLNSSFKKIAAALTVATSLSGCVTMDMNNNDTARIGAGLGRAAGVLAADALRKGNDGFGNGVVRQLGLGRAGADIGRAFGRQAGNPCYRTIILDNKAGHVRRDTSRCKTSHGLPSGMPVPRY